MNESEVENILNEENILSPKRRKKKEKSYNIEEDEKILNIEKIKTSQMEYNTENILEVKDKTFNVKEDIPEIILFEGKIFYQD